MPTKILLGAIAIISIANLFQTSETITISRQNAQNVARAIETVEVVQAQVEEVKIATQAIVERQDRLEDMVFGSVAFNKLSETQKRNARIAWEAAQENDTDPIFFTKLAFCESSLDDKSVNSNNDSRKTTDHGLFQINDYWHAEVDRECALSATCAADWSAKRIAGGYANEWYCSRKIASK